MQAPQISFDLLTKSSHVFSTWTGEASDLGWPPGYWPETIIMVGAGDRQTEYHCVKVELDGTHVYHGDGLASTVRIFND